MQNDSDIISYVSWSIHNESPLPIKDKLYTPSAETSSKKSYNRTRSSRSVASFSVSSIDAYSTKNKSFLSKLKRELRTLCCFICFLTCKSFKFHSLKVALILLSLMSLFTQMIQGGYISAITTSLQTQYNMSTSKIGIILSSFDILGVFAIPILSYIGSRYNKARVISICTFSYVLGAAVFTLPFFLGGKYKISNVNTNYKGNNGSGDSYSSTHDTTGHSISYDICKANKANQNFVSAEQTTSVNGLLEGLSDLTSAILSTVYSSEFAATSVSDQTTENYNLTTITTTSQPHLTTSNPDSLSCQRDLANTWPYYVFIGGQLLMSLGVAPHFSLGITYLCDNLEERSHAFYTGMLLVDIAFFFN